MPDTTTTGPVQYIFWGEPLVYVVVGPSLATSVALWVWFQPPNTADIRGFKRSLIKLCTEAFIAGYPITVSHDVSGEMHEVTVGVFDICPVGRAVHNDFYSVTGSSIPADAEMVFDSATATVTFAPDMIRPHWAFVEALPDSIPVGRNMVRLQNAAGWTSSEVPVEVGAGPPEVVRALYSGEPKEHPYTIVFVATPSIETATNVFIADPILTQRPDYHHTVRVALQNLLTLPEDVLWQGGQDRQIRFVSVFDATLPADDFNSLANGNLPNLLKPRPNYFDDFLNRYGIAPDLVFVISASDTYTRASASFSEDIPSASPAGASFTYDGVAFRHEPFVDKPGGATLSAPLWQGGMTALHEFLHAASDLNSGRVHDLYRDVTQSLQFEINKNYRALSTDPIPPVFANYNGVDYASDPARGGIGYPPTWVSFHPELIDPARPNVMDDFYFGPDSPQLCRLDRLTYAWYTDRLRTKLNR